MNTKLILKTVFLLAILLLLVLMGMKNPQRVSLLMPPLFREFSTQAAFMYFGFFALGVLTGTVLTAGGKRGGGGGGGKSKAP